MINAVMIHMQHGDLNVTVRANSILNPNSRWSGWWRWRALNECPDVRVCAHGRFTQ